MAFPIVATTGMFRGDSVAPGTVVDLQGLITISAAAVAAANQQAAVAAAAAAVAATAANAVPAAAASARAAIAAQVAAATQTLTATINSFQPSAQTAVTAAAVANTALAAAQVAQTTANAASTAAGAAQTTASAAQAAAGGASTAAASASTAASNASTVAVSAATTLTALTPATAAGTLDIAPRSIHAGARGWLDGFVGAGYEATLQTVSLSTHGCAGGVFGTRSSDQAQAGAQSGYAIGTFALNNNTAYPQTVYGGYFESIRYPGAGNTLGVEIDVTNLGARVTQSPYLMIPDGITPGLWLQAFQSRVAGLPAADPSCAIGILSIGCKWASGIVFSVGSVAGGVDNYAPPIAMDMPAAYSVVWRNPVDAQPVAVVRSDCTQIAGTGAGGSIIFNNAGVDFQSANGQAQIHYSNTNVTLGRTIFAQSVALGLIHIAADDIAAAAAGVGANELYVTSAGVVRCRIT